MALTAEQIAIVKSTAPVVKQLILRTAPVLGVQPIPEPDPNSLDSDRDPKNLRPRDPNLKLVNGRRNETY